MACHYYLPCICLINELISKNKGEISLFNFPFCKLLFSTLRIFHTPPFQHSAFSTLRVFNTPHFPHSAFFTLRVFHIPHFPHSALHVFHTPHSAPLIFHLTIYLRVATVHRYTGIINHRFSTNQITRTISVIL